MSSDNERTDPVGREPFHVSDADERELSVFTAIVRQALREELKPTNDAIQELRASLGLTNGTTKSIAHRVTDLETRLAQLEESAG